MNPIFPHPAPTAPTSVAARHPINTPPVSPAPSARRRDRIGRLTALAPQDTAAGLLWLAMNFPAVCDAMLDKIESDDIDEPSGQDPSRSAPMIAVVLDAQGMSLLAQPDSE